MASVDITGVRLNTGFQSGYYLSAYDINTQKINTALTFQTVNISNIVFSNGITINNGSEITFAYAGRYNIQFSLQVTNTNQQLHEFYLYLSKNTNPVAETSSVVTIYPLHGGVAGHNIAAWNFFVTAVAGDFYELVWGQNDKDVQIEYIGVPVVGIPAAPSVILTVSQI